jgi:hypothetical protein
MKNFSFKYTIVVLCLCLTYSCEKADIQSTSTTSNVKITNRWVDECGDCPNVDDCCCRIELISGEFIEFETCGTTDGDVATCTDDLDGCFEIDGKKNSNAELIEIIQPRLLFCMEENHSFIITVFDLDPNGVVINITCQAGSIGPQSINVPISAPGKYAFSVNGDCEIEQCYP